MKIHILLLILSLYFNDCLAIWCYQCTAATPGCMEPFNWHGIGYLGEPCPDAEDICVKLIERKGAQEVITRDCLSNFRAVRTDIPADTYEGCRPAAKDWNLANYVNNSIKELDTKSSHGIVGCGNECCERGHRKNKKGICRFITIRDWYDQTTWCFCFLDHRCNGATSISMTMVSLIPLCTIFVFASMLY